MILKLSSAEVTIPKVGEGQECGGTTQNHPAVDLPSSTFTWTIRNFSRLSIKKHYSRVFSKVDVTKVVKVRLKERIPIKRLHPLHSTIYVPKNTPTLQNKANMGQQIEFAAQAGTIVIQQNKEGVPEAGPSKSATQQGRLSSCAICLDAPIEGACIPCGHMPGCMSCLSNIEVNSWGCPICRAKIQKVVRIYTV
ncbi:hypothetical protein IFM89_000306 [Coptis chinensis]|uniref:RING-type domain-containing protein n=1 Tax=Coptis chinensis TaxID=261450 RepID=A0A835LH57_9MAGN|nr:hypothetical protein IFM89_000306 [Coptis chinensis]